MNDVAVRAGRLVRARSLRGTVRVPSDKSIGHRALISAALARGRSSVTLFEPGEDLGSTIDALRALGVAITESTSGRSLTLEIAGIGEEHVVGSFGSASVYCGNSGTSMRLLAGAVASGSGSVRLTGDKSLSRRPMERIAAPLRRMGADVSTTDGHAPISVAGRRPLRSKEHELPVSSAQLLGGICLAALAAEGQTAISVPGPTRDHTERLLVSMGARITRVSKGEGTLTTVAGPRGLNSTTIEVPGDFSSAAAWIVAASVHADAEILVLGVGLNPTRTALIEVLREMGADIEVALRRDEGGEPVGDVTVRSAGPLTAVSVGQRQVAALIDELPLLAVAMASADGRSEVRGATELRLKESDRVATMATALDAIGADVDELPDGWRIRRGHVRDATIVTRADHRIAMAMAVAAWSGVSGAVTLDDPDCVSISYPSFWSDAAALGAAG